MTVRTEVLFLTDSHENTKTAQKYSQVIFICYSWIFIHQERKRIEGEDEDEPEEEEEEEIEEEDPTVINDPKERELEILITPNHIVNLKASD